MPCATRGVNKLFFDSINLDRTIRVQIEHVSCQTPIFPKCAPTHASLALVRALVFHRSIAVWSTSCAFVGSPVPPSLARTMWSYETDFRGSKYPLQTGHFSACSSALKRKIIDLV